MEELNYQPNSLARSLQGKQAQLIGLIFPTVANPSLANLLSNWKQNFSNAAINQFYVIVQITKKKNGII